MTKTVFVFGSNLAGRHGAGAAKTALQKYGAVYGQAVGRQGDSYAIPTKDEQLKQLPLHQIKPYVDVFINYARSYPSMTFYVTKIGCGLAGYNDWEIAPLFKDAPNNCTLHHDWREIIINEWTA